MNRIFTLIISFHLLLISGIAVGQITNDTTTVVILSVNDMHAKIDNFPKFKALVDDIRRQYEYVLLVSAGDNFTGNPIVDQYPDQGYPMIDLMNKLGFTIGTIGNHEFDYGQETLKKRMKQANFPMISANIKSADPQGINPEPYKILSLENGIKVGFIGVIQRNTAGLPDSHPSKLEGITFSDGIETILGYHHLRDSCNIFVCLTHLGFEDDVKLTSVFNEPDLILGGHSHTTVSNPVEYNGVLVMQAGSGLKSLAKVTLKLVDGKVVTKQAETISIVNYPVADTTVLKLVEHYNDNKELNREIGIALKDISGNDELGSLMTDAVCAINGIEIAFQNNGGIRIEEIPQGKITLKDVYRLDPFGNEVVMLKLSVPEIKSLIINSYNREKMTDLQVSGLKYTIISDTSGLGVDVRLSLPDGSAVGNDRVFATGLSSYIVSSYDFKHEDEGKTQYITTAQALINFIQQRKEIDYSGEKRTFTEQLQK